MDNPSTPADLLQFTDEGKPKLPTGINVLTILTFIGSGIGILFTFLTPVIIKFSMSMMDKARSSGKEFTTKELTDMEKSKSVMELTQANMVPLMIIGLVGIALCIVGALWMRRLKKDGFWIYTGGELLPLIGSFILMGTGQFTGVFSVIIAIGIPVLFVVLYAMQRKYLVK